MQVLADTNILLRRIHRLHPQHQQAREAITRIVAGGDVICVTTQNLIECWTVCTRPIESNGLGLLPAHAIRVLSRLESATLLLREDATETYAEWRKLVTSHNVSGKKSHDARLVAAMKLHGVSHVLTFNVDDFSRFAGIHVIHPNSLFGTSKPESTQPEPTK